jgi:ABC-type proline/glycine betaine transport system permease subunit
MSDSTIATMVLASLVGLFAWYQSGFWAAVGILAALFLIAVVIAAVVGTRLGNRMERATLQRCGPELSIEDLQIPED